MLIWTEFLFLIPAEGALNKSGRSTEQRRKVLCVFYIFCSIHPFGETLIYWHHMIVQYRSTQATQHWQKAPVPVFYFPRTIRLLKLIPRYVICFWSSSQQKHSVPESCHKDRFPLLLGNGKVLLSLLWRLPWFLLTSWLCGKAAIVFLDSKRRRRKISFISRFQYSIRTIFVHGVLLS